MERAIRVAGIAARNVRIPRGRTRLARFLKAHAPPHDVTYRDEWGLVRKARLQDEVEAQGFVGVYALPVSVTRYIQPGDWVVDAGANVGLLTGQFCHLTGPTGFVWAIEPLPYNVERLRLLKELNHLEQLAVYAGALADTSGSAHLRLPIEGESAYASFTKSWDMHGSIEVPTWTLDELVEAANPDRHMAFLKIDVEGYEPRVLQGARRTLQELKPLVLCEFNDALLCDAGTPPQDLLAMFATLGYEPVGEVPPFEGHVWDVLLRHASRPM